MGGLGNQLFQIFAIMSYGIQYGHKFIFPYEKMTPGITPRTSYWDTFLTDLKIFTTYYNYNGTNNILYSFPFYNHEKHNYNEIPFIEHNKNVRIGGYFQSYYYFRGNEEKIFRLLKLQDKQNDIMNDYSYLFNDECYVISMHIRLGDYKIYQECHNVLFNGYFNNAILEMKKNLKNPDKKIRILYFNEEEDNTLVIGAYIDPLQTLFPDIEFVKVDDSIVDWKQMLIMSCCDHNIIANSSFSWWGAYFNRKQNKIVCYPSQWFGPILECNYTGDMFPPHWIKVNIS
jgi:hypothetical protein